MVALPKFHPKPHLYPANKRDVSEQTRTNLLISACVNLTEISETIWFNYMLA